MKEARRGCRVKFLAEALGTAEHALRQSHELGQKSRRHQSRNLTALRKPQSSTLMVPVVSYGDQSHIACAP